MLGDRQERRYLGPDADERVALVCGVMTGGTDFATPVSANVLAGAS